MKKIAVLFVLCLIPVFLLAQGVTPPTKHPMAERQNISISLRGGYQFSSLKDWEAQFDPKPKTALMGIGLEANYNAGDFFIVGAGYEYNFSQTVKITNATPNPEDEVTCGFMYATIKGGMSLGEQKEYYLYGGIDLGILKGTETLKLSGSTLEQAGDVFAFRPKVGLLSYFGDAFSGSMEAGYLIGKVSEVKFNDEPIPNYKLDFSGLSLLFAVSYHFAF